MNLHEYRNTVRHIQAPIGTQERILRVCREKNRKKVFRPALLVPATLVLVCLLAVSVFSNTYLKDTPLSVQVQASDISEEVDLAKNGTIDFAGETLFICIGNQSDKIERVDLHNDASRLTCYYTVETARQDSWGRYTLSVPYEQYAASVRDVDAPSTEELAALLKVVQKETERFDFVTDEMERFEKAYGSKNIDFQPLISGFQVFSKTSSSFVAIELVDTENPPREATHEGRDVSVVPGEEVEWHAGQTDDCVEVTVHFKDGKTLTGRIEITIGADGAKNAVFVSGK